MWFISSISKIAFERLSNGIQNGWAWQWVVVEAEIYLLSYIFFKFTRELCDSDLRYRRYESHSYATAAYILTLMLHKPLRVWSLEGIKGRWCSVASAHAGSRAGGRLARRSPLGSAHLSIQSSGHSFIVKHCAYYARIRCLFTRSLAEYASVIRLPSHGYF